MEKPHKRLDAWKLSMDLVIEIYNETDNARMDRIDKTITGRIRLLAKK